MASKTPKISADALALRRAEKSLGSARWAFSGAGKKDDRTKEQTARLKANVAKYEKLVKELRSKRDASKTAK